MLIETIKKELENHLDKTDLIKIGYIKEFLQAYILRKIYELEECKSLIFYGGTSLRFLFGLNRLSEDLDFVSKSFNNFDNLGKKLQQYFNDYDLNVNYKVQKFRIILNFKDFLSEFNLNFGNSKDLYIKIEISDHIGFCKNYKEQIYPIFRSGKSLLIRSFDKNTLFSTKINAVLNRKWEKQIGNNKITVKGRDIYDLFWYLSNDFKPNLDCIIGIDNLESLKQRLYEIIEKIDFREVILDIENFLEDQDLLTFLKEDGKNIILEKIREMN